MFYIIPKTWSSPRHNHHPLSRKITTVAPWSPEQDFHDASSSFSSAHLLCLADLASSPWLSKRFQRLRHLVKTSNLQNKKGIYYWEASDVGIFRSLHSLLIHIKSFHVWENNGQLDKQFKGRLQTPVSQLTNCLIQRLSKPFLLMAPARSRHGNESKLKQYLCFLHLFYSHRNMGSLDVGGPTTQV